MPSIDDVDMVLRLKAEAKQSEESFQNAQDMLIARMKRENVTEAKGSLGKVALVAPVRVVTSEPKLKKALGAALWKKVTKSVLDKPRLEAEMKVGNIDSRLVAQCSEEIPSSPYLNTTYAKNAEFPGDLPDDRLPGARRRQKCGA